MPTVILLGTLDTKGIECDYLRRCLHRAGCDVILVDCGIRGTPHVEAEVSREEVAEAAGVAVSDLRSRGDRGAAVATMARGAATIVTRLYDEGRFGGILGVGGSGGSALISESMRALPVGIPKLLVSTVASGDTRPYVGATDIAMLHSVVDIAGINRVSAPILANAAAAMAGMMQFGDSFRALSGASDARPLIGASMFGVTTPCVTEAQRLLEDQGYEVLVFHAVGTGGEAMEALAADGFFAGVLDVTTTELADELVGGVFSAGATRLEAAGKAGVPQVVSLGALDMVNFGPRETVPPRFADRNFYEHNASVTLMRTTPDECIELGRRIARKLNTAIGPTALFVPLRGVSMLDTEGGAFSDPDADRALISAIRENVGDSVEVYELDLDINAPRFARAMAERLIEMIQRPKAVSG